MDFGKLPNVDQVDFSFPPEPRGNEHLLASSPVAERQTLYIGPTGYNMKAWVGKWYPPGAKEKDFLKYYAEQFNTIEFNTTHYRMPDTGSVERWKKEAPDDFRYCPKVPQSISHSRDLGLSSDEPFIFGETINGLEQKLGRSFMQLPPHFSPRDLPVLKRFLERYAALTPLAVEVRHPDFFTPGPAAEAYFDLLETHKVTAVITDVSGRRDVCHMRLSNPVAMIRFVGNGLHPTDYTRIEAWAQRLQHWFAQGLQEAYFFTHEPDNLLAPELTAFCAERFKKAMPEVTLRGPKEVAGIQGSLF